MPKTIVEKTEIQNDPKLAIVKAFRLATKKIGDLNTAIVNTTDAEDLNVFNAQLVVMRAKKGSLKMLADEQGFKIWTNENGKTGHTYEKDYKATNDEDNDWDAFQARIHPVDVETPGTPTLTSILAETENDGNEEGSGEE